MRRDEGFRITKVKKINKSLYTEKEPAPQKEVVKKTEPTSAILPLGANLK